MAQQHTIQTTIPLFQSILKLKGGDGGIEGSKPFFLGSKKYVLDIHDYLSWEGDRPDEKWDFDGVLKIKSPYSTAWFECFDLGVFEKRSIVYQTPLGPVGISGAGYDLNAGRIYCAVLKGDFNADCLLSFPFPDDFFGSVDSQVPELTTIYQHVTHSIKNFLYYIEPEFIGVETRYAAIGKKLRRGKLKNVNTTFSVVHRKKKHIVYEQPADKQSQGPIDWQFRWPVKGHWRKIKGLGRDPDGNIIAGFTWVKEFIKGPESKPMIDRVTIVTA